jgi:NAD(P)-dependent dehydrogenase (short-subunit alcohol dehydrogenase family)
MSTNLTGTVALITGATSGIGKATVFALAGRGAHVLVGGRNAARGEAVVTSLRASGAKADFIAVDLGSSGSARELARRATGLGDGQVDILVNNAAIFPMAPRRPWPRTILTPCSRSTLRCRSCW